MTIFGWVEVGCMKKKIIEKVEKKRKISEIHPWYELRFRLVNCSKFYIYKVRYPYMLCIMKMGWILWLKEVVWRWCCSLFECHARNSIHLLYLDFYPFVYFFFVFLPCPKPCYNHCEVPLIFVWFHICCWILFDIWASLW